MRSQRELQVPPGRTRLYGRGVTQEAVRIGIDENGLGPRLGPLVVTAVVAVTSGDGHARAESRPKGALRQRLDDSKKLVAYRDNALGEAWARAIARRMGHGDLRSPEAVVRVLSLDAPEVLRTPCPREHAAQCWSAAGEEFGCDDKLLARVERDLARLAEAGVNVTRAACVVTCTRRLNEGVERGLTRFDMDLHAMERLTLEARERAGRDVVATCGKVGGFDRYAPAFGPLGGRLHAVAVEGRARSEYVMPGLGSIAFVRDADARHLLVCMASLVGKWVRDVLMGRIVRYHRADAPELPDASGYHDPVTTRFIDATRLSRKDRGLPDDCFERKALGNRRATGEPELTT
jgi:ribonuclease HII